MGVELSTLNTLVRDEFNRLVSHNRDHLVLGDVLDFHLSPCGWGVDPENIGVLFVADQNLDGRFTLDELQLFARSWNNYGSGPHAFEIETLVHSRCMLQFWKFIQTDEGLQDAVNWLTEVVKNNYACGLDLEGVDVETTGPQTSASDTHLMPSSSGPGPAPEASLLEDAPRFFPHDSDTLFVHQQSLFGLHRILGHQQANHGEVMDFINTLQRVAEDKGLLELSNPALDEWLPEPVLREYLSKMLLNCRHLVKDMELLESLPDPHGPFNGAR